MKRITLTLIIVGYTTLVFGQITNPDTTKDKHNNEIGIDATPLLQQFFFFNSDEYFSPNIHPYYLMYRRYINKLGIRAGIGGTYSTDESVPNDTTVTYRKRTILDFRLGIERKTDFAKRWQFFYGLDIWSNIDINYNDYQYSNGGQKVGYDNQTMKYGVAPLLGFRLKINERISITTETNFQFYYYSTISKQIYKPDESLNTKKTNKGYQTNFIAPASLFFTFNF